MLEGEGIGDFGESKEIGQVLVIGPRTVDTYRNRLMDKGGLRSVADVVRWAMQRETLG